MLNVETNSVARKRRTATRIVSGTSSSTSPSKLSAAKRAGGQRKRDTHGAIAASKNSDALRGASGQKGTDAHRSCATRKVAPRSRTAANSKEAPIENSPQSTNKPRATVDTTTIVSPRAAPYSDGQPNLAIQVDSAVAVSIPDVVAIEDAQAIDELPPRQEPQASLPLPANQAEAIASINDAWRKRQGIIKAMTKLSLQAQASMRGGRDREEAAKHYGVVAKDVSHKDYPTIAPYLEAQVPLARYRGDYEKTLVQHVKTLPIYAWAKAVSGLGDISLAGLVGECSGYNMETNELWSIGQMKSPSAMWKRLGLAVMGGVRQGDATAGLSKSDWVEHGYVKTRRSVVWNIGECIVKAQWRKENTVHAYGKFYGEEKARLQALNEAGEYAEQAARIVERMKKAGSKPLAENVAGRLTAGHINNRAKRHMTKRLIRDLWVAWREADRRVEGYAPVAEAA